MRHNISARQLAGYAVANLVGLAIVLTAVQFYRDITSVWNSKDSFISRDYLIISRKVNGMKSLLGGGPKGFTKADIAKIEQQPWARRVGQFTASEFNVTAAVDLGGSPMSTALFLESIPSEFFDVKPKDWSYTPGQQQPVPIIISKDYLTLYNFGFATSRGLPQISEAMISMLPLRLSISGAGKQQWLPARIAGFSSRLNTIAAPEEFMEWANNEFADQPAGNPQRLIIEVNTPGDPAIERFLKQNSYESAGDKVDNGRAAYFLNIATAVVVAVGTLISALAFFILLLSIYLLLQKNRRILRNLMMLGYSPSKVARPYHLIVATVNGTSMAAAMATVAVGSAMWSTPLKQIGANPASIWLTLMLGLVITLLVTMANFVAINRKVRKSFPQPKQK